MKTQKSITYQFGEVQLSYKKKLQVKYHTIKSSNDASKIIRQIFPLSQMNYREHVYAIYLNMKNGVIGYHLITVGGINQAVVDVRIILQGGLLCNCVGILLCHNHPSGNTKPSSSDIALTEKINLACKTIDLKLLDHIIITENSYYSFADNGKL